MSRHNATLGTLLRQILEATDGDVEATYRSLGLDYRPRFTPVVRYLAEHGATSIRKLSLDAKLSHSALSQTVAEMARKDLVRLERSTADARERVVTLTAKAMAMLPTLQRCWAAANAAADGLSAQLGIDLPAELARAAALLDERSFADRIAHELAKAPPRIARRTQKSSSRVS
jgi:DNA-binding MarR family transcriptional regulator